MRKIALFFVLLIINWPVFSQQIKYVKLTDDCWEFMTTDESFHPKGERYFSVAYQVYNYINESNPDNKIRYFLILSFRTYDYDRDIEIPSGGRLLIKTGTEDVISSTNDANRSIRVYSQTSGYSEIISCHEYVAKEYGSFYIIRGKYELTFEDITKMVTNGVIKIRVETTGESIDINLPLEESIKVGKEKKTLNRLGASVAAMVALSDSIFNPLKSF